MWNSIFKGFGRKAKVSIKHYYLLTNLTSWLPWSIDGDLYALWVDCNDAGGAADADDQVEGLPPPAPSDDPEVVELGHVVLHHLRVVPQLPTKVLIVADSQVHHRPVLYVTQRNHFEGRGKGLVRPPMVWKCCAENIGGTWKEHSFQKASLKRASFELTKRQVMSSKKRQVSSLKKASFYGNLKKASF